MRTAACIAVLVVFAAAAAEAATTARPDSQVRGDAPSGRRLLARGAELYVPEGYTRRRPSAFVLTLHGAYHGPDEAIGRLLPLADDAGLILLAPKSRDGTWDAIRGDYGPDVAGIDDLLRAVFARYAVDPQRVFVSGFSDGASYALSLGLTNGDLFKGVVAFSPGFAGPAALRGKPRIFISHGTTDTVLPIQTTSRRLVPELRKRGYRVTYREFVGPHTVPSAIARRAVAWLAGGRSGRTAYAPVRVDGAETE